MSLMVGHDGEGFIVSLERASKEGWHKSLCIKKAWKRARSFCGGENYSNLKKGWERSPFLFCKIFQVSTFRSVHSQGIRRE